jgi:hypothetical protein
METPGTNHQRIRERQLQRTAVLALAYDSNRQSRADDLPVTDCRMARMFSGVTIDANRRVTKCLTVVC